MKIRTLELKGDYLFGDLVIDFTDSENNPMDTIIIAGENGCGKTRILNILYDFSLLTTDVSISDGEIILDVCLDDTEIAIVKEALRTSSISINMNNFTGNMKITKDCSGTKAGWNIFDIKLEEGTMDSGKWTGVTIHKFNGSSVAKGVFKSIYSSVEINYTPKQIKNVTSKELDVKIIESVNSGKSDLATEIKQLFIDIQNNDSNDLNQWVNENRKELVPDSILNKRIKRFKNAFSKVFTELNYSRIETINNEKEVIFEKNNSDVRLQYLSSGEKQIVFRGAFLLKDLNSLKGNIVLIDEPEISLHPRWQLNILDYYRGLFKDEDQVQTSQIFIATHSPYIIHSSKRFNDKVIILESNNDNKVIVKEVGEFATVGKEALVEQAFNVNAFENDKPTVFVEGETDEIYLNAFYQSIYKGEMPFIIKWIGSYEGGSAVNTGDTALNKLKSFIESNPFFLKEPILLFYDSDTNKPASNKGLLRVRTMPKNPDNTLYKIGIENMLTLPTGFDKDKFYTKNEKVDNYGAKSEIYKLDKTKLCEYICKREDRDKFLIKFSELNDIINKAFELQNKNPCN